MEIHAVQRAHDPVADIEIDRQAGERDQRCHVSDAMSAVPCQRYHVRAIARLSRGRP